MVWKMIYVKINYKTIVFQESKKIEVRKRQKNTDKGPEMDIRKYQISQYEFIHVLSKVARNYKLLNLYIFDHIIIGIYSC